MQAINPVRRTYIAAAVLVALFAPFSNPALPQPLPLPVPSIGWPGVPSDDVARMHVAAARLYEGSSTSTVERWRNPDTKDAGEVQLIRSFIARGMPCRTIRYTIQYQANQNRLEHYVVNWCHVPGGDWKIVELPRPR